VRFCFISWAIALFLIASPMHAEEKKSSPLEPFKIDFPLDCTLGENCFIQNHVDVHQHNHLKVKDYRCGSLTYKGHQGVDIRVSTLHDMTKSVMVIAAADGIVIGVRNNMPDNLLPNFKKVNGKECGNGVVIAHGQGWVTQYCHLHKGSIRVRKGEKVKRGQILGAMGMSGHTVFPHLHLSVRHDKKIVDPFIGEVSSKTRCGGPLNSLWTAKTLKTLNYQPTNLLGSGFSLLFPNEQEIVMGLHKNKTLPSTTEKFIFWVYLIGIIKDDQEHFIVHDPDGKIIIDIIKPPIPKNKATWMSFVGKKIKFPKVKWKRGEYTCEYKLLRQDSTGQTKTIVSVKKSLNFYKLPTTLADASSNQNDVPKKIPPPSASLWSKVRKFIHN